MARFTKGVFRKNLTITGPRSVGKTTISKEISKRLLLEYISSDELADKELKKEGGLDKSIKSNKIRGFIKNKSFNLLKSVYESKNGFVMDLAGGAISSEKHSDVSLRIRDLSKNNSLVVMFLPSKNIFYSIIFLFRREIKRKHFKDENKFKIFKNTLKDYRKLRKISKEWPDIVFYVGGKDLSLITNEVVDFFEDYKEKWENLKVS